jgi:hypothetical protein
MLIGVHRIKHNPFSLAKEIGKGKSSKTENLDNTYPTLIKHHEKKIQPYPSIYQQRLSRGEQILTLAHLLQSTLSTPARMMISGETKNKTGTFVPT